MDIPLDKLLSDLSFAKPRARNICIEDTYDVKRSGISDTLVIVMIKIIRFNSSIYQDKLELEITAKKLKTPPSVSNYKLTGQRSECMHPHILLSLVIKSKCKLSFALINI